MKILIVAVCIIVFFLLLGLMPIGAGVAYDSHGICVCLKAGPMKLRLGKKKRNSGRNSGKEKKKERKGGGSHIRISATLITETAKAAVSLLGGLLCHGHVPKLHIRFTAGCDDPADAAVMYVVAGLVLDAMDAHAEGCVPDKDLQADIDFDLPSPRAELDICATLRLGRLVWEVVRAGVRILHGYRKGRKAAAMII